MLASAGGRPLQGLRPARHPIRRGAFLAKVREVSVLGNYPTRGRRLWLFLAAVAVIGLIGVVMMLFTASK